jgi:hypothetical protein
MHGDEQRYYDLLMALDGLLHQTETILDAHADCPGCGLCHDATGIEYFADMLLDLIIGDAPENMHLSIQAAYKSSKRMDATAKGPEPAEHPPPPAQQ